MYEPGQPHSGEFVDTSRPPESGSAGGSGSSLGSGLDGSGLDGRSGHRGSGPGGSRGFGGSGSDGFAGTGDALAAVAAGLAFLTRADAATLPVAEVADCLRELERAESVHTAARARMLTAFTAQAGYEADGHGGPKPWLIWQTRITRGAAAGALGWARRLGEHSKVADALTAGEVSQSWARQVCDWTDQLPEDCRADADHILLGAAAGGADLADLSGLFEEIYARCARPDKDGDDGFTRRAVSLAAHFQGAGKLDGNLTPECTAALQAVLESLGKKAGPEDDRTMAQRRHDALEEACRRLIASNGLPDVAGQPVQVQLHMTLDQLRALPGAPDAERAWRAGRAAEDGQPGWVTDPKAAEAYACDAQIAPLVTGYLDPAALAAMTDCWLRQGVTTEGYLTPAGLAAATRGLTTAQPLSGEPYELPRWARKRLADTLLRHAADALSGPGGLASFLRTSLLPGTMARVSLPLDVGTTSSTIPPWLRRAVIERDRHCAFPGCTQPPAACHVHHIVPRSEGGATALGNLGLLCTFHHLIAVHRWGWTLALNGDGTITATSPDGKRVLHSHGPPAVPVV